MPTVYIKHCLHCNKEFRALPRKKNQKYCSQNCAKNAKRNPNRLLTCINCQTELKQHQYKFCSRSCSAILSNKQRTITSREKQQKTLKKTMLKKGINRTNEKEIYYLACRFKKWPLDTWKKIQGIELLKTYGMWHPTRNPNGVVRDHILTKSDGWVNKIDPQYISHPANCRIITNLENVKKGKKSNINLLTLLELIKNFDKK